MRRLTISVFLIVFTLVVCAAAKDETIDELKASFESARPEDRTELAIRIAQHQLRNADKLYGEGNIEQGRAAVDDIVTYSEKARDAVVARLTIDIVQVITFNGKGAKGFVTEHRSFVQKLIEQLFPRSGMHSRRESDDSVQIKNDGFDF